MMFFVASLLIIMYLFNNNSIGTFRISRSLFVLILIQFVKITRLTVDKMDACIGLQPR